MPFVTALEKYRKLSETSKQAWRAATKAMQYKAGTELLVHGGINDRFFFIEKGLARTYHFDDSKCFEVTSYFASEGDFFCSVSSFFCQKPATEHITLLEDSRLHTINYQDYRQLLNVHNDLNNLFVELYEQRLAADNVRIKLMLEPDYTKRYVDFLKVYPHLANRVKIGHIASFLGMSFGKLSHIRGELAKKNRQTPNNLL